MRTIFSSLTTLELIHLAKYSLLRARLHRQEAGYIDEQEEVLGGTLANSALAQRRHQQAQDFRMDAHLLLKEIEVRNGKAFSQGNLVYRLSEYLVGRAFRQWSTYKTMYLNHPIFCGVDPE